MRARTIINSRKRPQTPVFLIKSLEPEPRSRARLVERAVFLATGLRMKDYALKNRYRHLMEARVLFSWYAATFGLSTSTIGKLLSRDHSSVTYMYRKYREWMVYDFRFRKLSLAMQKAMLDLREE